MIGAKLVVRGDERDYGWWHFVALPSPNDVVAFTINDEAVTFTVDAVIHRPVKSDILAGGKAVPSATIFVTPMTIET